MDKRSRKTAHMAKATVITVVLSLLSGCGTTSKATDWLRGRTTANADEAIILGAPNANDYLDELYELSAGDPAKQKDIYEDAASAAQLTPGPSTNLRFGLVLASAGHPNTNPERAQTVLRGVLDQSELLTSAEISLATIYLTSVERLNTVSSEARRTQESTTRAARMEEQAISQRLAAAEAENRRLKSALDEAEQKLEAITSIERSIRDNE
mgnify:FL=1